MSLAQTEKAGENTSELTEESPPASVSARYPYREQLMGVCYDNMTKSQALLQADVLLNRSGGKSASTLFFLNVHSIYLAESDSDFRKFINEADLVLPDGSGIAYAGKALAQPVKANLNGTDFIPLLLKQCGPTQKSVYLLGSTREICLKAKTYVEQHFAGIRVVGARSGYFSKNEEEEVIAEINLTRPDILLVAMGSPRQEKWIYGNAYRLDAGICCGVGGLFDFWSGKFKRSPMWIRRYGVEWLYRFMQDPFGKWKRVLFENPRFVLQVRWQLLRNRIKGTSGEIT